MRPEPSDQPAPRAVSAKLDPRLQLLLSMPREDLRTLHEREQQKVQQVADDRRATIADLDQRRAPPEERLAKLEAVDRQAFKPLSSGIRFSPAPAGGGAASVADASVLIVADVSASDLRALGVTVRSQAGNIFTADLSLDLIPTLEAVHGVRYIELARPLESTLDAAIPYTQANTLHQHGVTGKGVVVGIIDSVPLDFYHPDFRNDHDATRLLFLWDQTLTPQGKEKGPPVAPTLPGFLSSGAATYGVEYDQAAINAELKHKAAIVPYATVRTKPNPGEHHGTLVTGCAAGNGRADTGKFMGTAPEADIIFVVTREISTGDVGLFADNTNVLDAFAYIFARASQLGKACVVNLSASDNVGPHDGSRAGERFLDQLLVTSGRAITLSAGNSNGTASHAEGAVAQGATTNLVLHYGAGATHADRLQIWYGGKDRFSVMLTAPTTPPSKVGPVVAGAGTPATISDAQGARLGTVTVTSVVGDPLNSDNVIDITILPDADQQIPSGNWTIALTGDAIVDGGFHAWVSRENRGLSAFQAPRVREGHITLGETGTARRPITVGNHDKTKLAPIISPQSGCGATRDGRIKPELSTVGIGIIAPIARDMTMPLQGQPLYSTQNPVSGTSFSAPIVAGACALIFECRGPSLTSAALKKILQQTVGTDPLATFPNDSFGHGFLQVGTCCT